MFINVYFIYLYKDTLYTVLHDTATTTLHNIIDNTHAFIKIQKDM